MLDHLSLFFRLQLKRHFGNPSLWLILLAAPIAARFMVPDETASYSVLSINGAYPRLTAAVIGLELGVISAMMLSPFVYVFLRSSRASRHPWQIEDVTASRRFALNLGHWMADTVMLWFVILILALSGVALSIFRLPWAEVHPLETMITCMLISCPAFAFIAAIRVFFSARPWLRGAWGDVLFFILWIAGVGMGAGVATGTISALMDMFGFASPLVASSPEPIEQLAIGATPSTAGLYIAIDALKGVLQPEYIAARLFWLGSGAAAALLASMLYRTRKQSKVRKGRISTLLDAVAAPFGAVVQKTLPIVFGFSTPLTVHMQQILRPGWVPLVLIALAGAGYVLPFRGGVGPALWLLLLFPLSKHAALWSGRAAQQFLGTLPATLPQQVISRTGAHMLLANLLVLPSLIQALETGKALGDIAFIALGLPLLVNLLTLLSGSSFAPRLILLILWYGYLNIG